jgi:taurine dioxygenase
MALAATAAATEFEIVPLSPVMGAEIRGLDLWAPMDDATFARLRAAFVRHKVLRVPGQPLDEPAHIAFSRRFGPLQVHVLDQYRHPVHSEIYLLSNVDRVTGKPKGEHPDKGTMLWHTDLSFQATPALATILYGIAIPRAGGETEFCDLQAAWDALPEAEQRRIGAMRCIHDLESSRVRSKDLPLTEKQKREAPPVEHPVVRIHPETGRRCIYLGDHAEWIVGMPYEEGRALIEELNALAVHPDLTYEHRWQPHELIVWDNRCLMHRATPYDPFTERRVVRRCTVLGEEPVGPA